MTEESSGLCADEIETEKRRQQVVGSNVAIVSFLEPLVVLPLDN